MGSLPILPQYPDDVSNLQLSIEQGDAMRGRRGIDASRETGKDDGG